MITTEILVPPAVLVVWTMIMAIWLNVDRVRALGKAKINTGDLKPGARGSDLAQIAPGMRDWPAHNYNHLMEQPTIFYAASVILALGGAAPLDTGLAWAYVVIRVLHSIWQATINTLQIRSALFSLSSMVMLVMAVRALLAVI